MKALNSRVVRVGLALSLGLPAYLSLFLIRGYSVEKITWYAYLEYAAVTITALLVLFELLTYKSSKLESYWSWKGNFRKRMFWELTTTIFLSTLVISGFSAILYKIIWRMELHIASLFLFNSLGLFIALFFTAFANTEYLIHYWNTSKERADKLQEENRKAQLKAIQNQVTPHFLFNNFSVLNALIDKEPEEAKMLVNKLSDVYRYINSSTKKEVVEVVEELKFVEDYFFILKAKFEGKIALSYDNIVATESANIPPVTIQQLVENAVKHNEVSDENPLKIDICCENEYLWVSNPKQPKNSEDQNLSGFGLSNLSKRYSYLTDRVVHIVDDVDRFCVGLPLISVK